MATLPVSENLEKVPDSLRRELCEFLKNDERFQQFEQMLQRTGLVLEKDEFQIPIHSVEELYAIKSYLSEEMRFSKQGISN